MGHRKMQFGPDLTKHVDDGSQEILLRTSNGRAGNRMSSVFSVGHDDY